MAKETFKRYEIKFMLNTKQYYKLQELIKEHMVSDIFNKDNKFYTISNLYLDNDNDYLIRTSLDKPNYKEKLRLRAYGVPMEEDKAYLEIKKKFDGVVYKRRTEIKLKEAYELINKLDVKEQPYINKQVLNEIKYALGLYNVYPKVYIAYDRKAYFGKEDSEFRITFDKNIRTRRYDLRLEKGDYGVQLLNPDLWLMEVKTDGKLPLWLVKFFSENQIYKTSFSKYGTEFKNYIINKTEEAIKYA